MKYIEEKERLRGKTKEKERSEITVTVLEQKRMGKRDRARIRGDRE